MSHPLRPIALAANSQFSRDKEALNRSPVISGFPGGLPIGRSAPPSRGGCRDWIHCIIPSMKLSPSVQRYFKGGKKHHWFLIDERTLSYSHMRGLRTLEDWKRSSWISRRLMLFPRLRGRKYGKLHNRYRSKVYTVIPL